METNEELHTFEAYLPIFRGFYGSPYFDSESDCEREFEHINEERTSKGLELLPNDSDIDWDITSWYKATAEKITDEVAEELKDSEYITDWQFVEIDSPKFYNYSNDKIVVNFTLSPKNLENIKNTIRNNYTDFEGYLRDTLEMEGFISNYSTFASEWKEKTKDFTEFDHNELQVIFQFLLGKLQGITESDICDFESAQLDAKNYEDLINKPINELACCNTSY